MGDLIGKIYVIGAAGTFLAVLIVGLVIRVRSGEPNAIPQAAISAIMSCLLWPIALPLFLSVMQAEFGIFWRSEDWKPESLWVLEIMHTEGRDMSAWEIQKASKGRVGGRAYQILRAYERIRFVSSRLATNEEIDQRYESEVARAGCKKRGLKLWRITEQGRRYHLQAPRTSPSVQWEALPA